MVMNRFFILSVKCLLALIGLIRVDIALEPVSVTAIRMGGGVCSVVFARTGVAGIKSKAVWLKSELIKCTVSLCSSFV